LKLNWGVMSTSNKSAQPTATTATPNANLKAPTAQQQQQQQPQGPEHSIYVGELGHSVDENVLVEFFSQRYRTVTGAKMIVDPVTRQSKGYGFVKFSDPQEAQSAIREMQGTILRGRAIKTNQAHIKASSTTDSTAGLNSNFMLNPLLASLTAGAMPNAGYMMGGADNLAMANYAAQQNLQNAQMYQANYLGMQNLGMMPNLQGLQTLQANPAFGYPANLLAMQNQQGMMQGLNAMQPNQAFQNQNFAYSTGSTDPNAQNQQQQQQQVYQAYQQPQMMGAYNAQNAMAGYGNVQGMQGIQVTNVPANSYYPQQQQQQGMYQQQQQPYNYGIQTQIIPNQQQPQMYQGMPLQQQQQQPQLQNGASPYQQYNQQQTTPQKQPPLISPTQLNQRFPGQNQGQNQGQKPIQPSPKNQNMATSPLFSSKNVNTLLPSKSFGEQSGINAIIPGMNIEPLSVPQGQGDKIEEEKPQEDSMVFNPGFIETNFRFDFIGSDKMTNIL